MLRKCDTVPNFVGSLIAHLSCAARSSEITCGLQPMYQTAGTIPTSIIDVISHSLISYPLAVYLLKIVFEILRGN